MKRDKIKVAVCISGQMRSFKRCNRNLLKYIIEPYDTDVFIHTWDVEGSSHKESSDDEIMVNESEIIKLYKPKSLVIESQVDGMHNNFLGRKVPKELIDVEPIHYRSALPMYYQISECFDLMKNHSKINNIDYDVVIRVRPDTMFNEQIPAYIIKSILKDKSKVFYAAYAIDTRVQVCDKFALGGYDGMDKYCSVWNHINDYWKTPLGIDPPKTHRVGERLLKYHVKYLNIEAYPFFMDIYNLRINGEKVFYREFRNIILLKFIYILKNKLKYYIDFRLGVNPNK